MLLDVSFGLYSLRHIEQTLSMDFGNCPLSPSWILDIVLRLSLIHHQAPHLPQEMARCLIPSFLFVAVRSLCFSVTRCCWFLLSLHTDNIAQERNRNTPTIPQAIRDLLSLVGGLPPAPNSNVSHCNFYC